VATLQTFGGGTTDFILDPSNNAKPLANTPYTVLDAATLLPATGLLDASGVSTSQLVSDSKGRYAGSAMLAGTAYYLEATGSDTVVYRFGPMVTTTAVAQAVDMLPQIVAIASSASASATSAAAAAAAAAAVGTSSNSAIDNRVKWQPSTAYALGQQVLSPNNDVVKANTAHTSSAAYATDVAMWDLSASYARKTDIVYRVGTGVGDYATVQAAHDAAPTGGVVLLPPGNTTHTTPISVTKSITLRGSAYYTSRIVANGVNGIEVADGVTDFHMENIEVACATRYSTTTNTLVGIKVGGATGSRPFNHVYRDVYVDGFQTAYMSDYLWGSTFSNFRTAFGLIGMDIYGLSVNNFLGDSSIAVQQVAGSKGVRLAGRSPCPT
jgi:hypothetical protein